MLLLRDQVEPHPKSQGETAGHDWQPACLDLSQGIPWITLPWQSFKQHVPSLPLLPVLHRQGPGGISALVGLQAACRQLYQVALWACVFQRAPTAACSPIVLHKSNVVPFFFFNQFYKTATAYFLPFVCCRGAVLCLALQSWSLLDSEAFVFWVQRETTKNVERIQLLYQDWSHCEKWFPFVGKITTFSFKYKPNVFYLGYFCLRLQCLEQWLWIAALLQIPVVHTVQVKYWQNCWYLNYYPAILVESLQQPLCL